MTSANVNPGVENFDALDKVEGTEEVKVEPGSGSDLKSKIHAAAKKALTETPELAEVTETCSDSIELVNVLVYSDKGNIMNGREISNVNGVKKYEKIPTPSKVGAIIRNVGQDVFTVMQRHYAQNANGDFEKVNETPVAFKPGDTIVLSQRDLVKFCSIPTISLKMKDGVTLVPSGKVKKDNLTMDEMLASYYIKFASTDKRTANDSSIQIQVGQKINDDEWVVKKEYQNILGFLQNKGGSRTSKKSGSKTIGQNVQNALYLSQLIAEAGEKQGAAVNTHTAAPAPEAPQEAAVKAPAAAKKGKKA